MNAPGAADSTTHGSTLSPCAGRCSTVFGDAVCRGCRRYSHEVIDWNRFDVAAQHLVWQRLDQQLDQIVLPRVPVASWPLLQQFLQARQVRLPEIASQGRQAYEVLRRVQRQPAALPHSGLQLGPGQLPQVWAEVERAVYALACAHHELAWGRWSQSDD